ncbi:AIG2 family protein [Natrialba chahannaoensis JCM 10990]|uniref:AIG2 family protein n=1 Tax=Natrialba chahannaoensis JCM 10990 TaxID=1227492 RepID=M0AUL8_9EURY|nr:gamma-glutamylcyclotransferase family protein [Natrialba chahannaoensis]ELZ01638.1 AIG2 family protein [Natrialba chahannaoensis JCM 10990]
MCAHALTFVFVYGTLTDREQASAVLGTEWPDTEIVGDAVLEGCRQVDGQYPTLAPAGSATDDSVMDNAAMEVETTDGETTGSETTAGETTGTLLTVTDSGLERLDRYEGVEHGLYVRVQVPWLTSMDADADVDPDVAADMDLGTGANADGRPVDEDGQPPVWTYVGNPDRLGTESVLEWPRAPTFEDGVRDYIETHDVGVRLAKDSRPPDV